MNLSELSVVQKSDAANGDLKQRFTVCDTPLTFEEAQQIEAAMLETGTLPRPLSSCLIWSMPQGLVVPKSISSQPLFTDAAETMKSKGWPVHVRITGGDLTPQAAGVLNISYVFSNCWDTALSIEAMYKRLCQPIIDFLQQDFGLPAYCASVEGAFCDGKYNIVVDGLKIAGTAQKWRPFHTSDGEKHAAVLGHVALLYDAPIDVLIGASNEFYSECGGDKQLEVKNHANLSDLLGSSDPGALAIMNGLLARFSDQENT